jgi:hypothetical protein
MAEFAHVCLYDRAGYQWSDPVPAPPEAFSPLGDLPIAVITHGQPFPGPFAVLEKSWREGQDRLARLRGTAFHMIQNDEPEIVLEAIRSLAVKVS